MRKNLILGTATNYKYPEVCLFLKSLRSTDKNIDVVLLVSSDIEKSTEKQILDGGAQLIYVPASLLKFNKFYANSRIWKIHKPLHKVLYSIYNRHDDLTKSIDYVKRFHLISGSRYCFYYEFLKHNLGNYDYVLISDVRDVIFQSDPFCKLSQSRLLKFYCEDNTIANSFYTAYWIRNAFGEKVLKKVSDKASICSGTTIGDPASLLIYLEQMIRVQASITGGLTGLGGFDQGVHNYLIHNDYFTNCEIAKNYFGEVATISNQSLLNLNPNGTVIDSDGFIIPIIHQYDRFPDLKLKVLADILH